MPGATTYEIWYGTFNDSSLATQYGGDILGTTCTITGLTDGTAYFVWIKAKNSGGSSELSVPATVMLPPDAPGAPTLTPAANQVTVTWMAVAGATAYDVWYGISGNSGQAVQYGTDLTVTNCTITGLASGTIYYVWVKAKNSGGCSGFSAPANVILPPGIPGAPVLTSGVNQLTAAWTAVTGAAFYEVWYGTSSDSSTACLFGTVTAPVCTITGLASGTVYYVWVQAGNSSGTSGFSLPANQITIPDPPVPSLTAASNQLTVTWGAVTGASAYQVWYGTSSDSGVAVQYGNDLTTTTCTHHRPGQWLHLLYLVEVQKFRGLQ